MSDTLTVEEAKDIIASYKLRYREKISTIAGYQKDLLLARKGWNELIASGLSTNEQNQQSSDIVYELERLLQSEKAYLKTLYDDYVIAQSMLNGTIDITSEITSDVNTFQGPTGPQGEQGPKGIGSNEVGPTGPSGYDGTIWEPDKNEEIGCLEIVDEMIGDRLSVTNGLSDSINATHVNIDNLSIGTIDPSDLSVRSIAVPSSSFHSCTCIDIYTDYLDVIHRNKPIFISTSLSSSYDYDNSGTLNIGPLVVSNLNLSGILTSTSGLLIGTCITPDQNEITSLGILSTLDIYGSCNSASSDVTGLYTSANGIHGLVLSNTHDQITQFGTLNTLNVQGTMKSNSVILSGIITATAGINASVLMSNQTKITGLSNQQSITVTAIMDTLSMYSSGISSTGGLVGSIYGNQTNLNQLGTLDNLTLSGNSKLSRLNQAFSGSCAFISTTTGNTNDCVLAIDNISSVKMTQNNGWYLQDVSNSIPFAIGSSGNTSFNNVGKNPLVLFDTGSSTTKLSDLYNPNAYIGIGSSGVVFGHNNNTNRPYIAASKSILGTSLPLLISPHVTIHGSNGNVSFVSSNLQIGTERFINSNMYYGIGSNQSFTTYSSPASSRKLGITYTNNTGKPIHVFVRTRINRAFVSECVLYADNIIIDKMATTFYGATDYPGNVRGIIPNGVSYRATFGNTAYDDLANNLAVTTWIELC